MDEEGQGGADVDADAGVTDTVDADTEGGDVDDGRAVDS